VSKESRRAARLARESRRIGAAGSAGALAPGATPAPGTTPGTTHRPPSSGPSGSARAGRRDRVRHYEQRSFLERYRTAILGIAGVAVVAVVVGFVFLGATQKSYECSSLFMPDPTPSPGPSDRLGYVENDMGNNHISKVPQRYTLCPPASGPHFAASGLGPIRPRVYGPNDSVGPPNWIHNMEHGAIVILYRGDSPGATAEGQASFREFFNTFPPSPICKIAPGVLSPVIARFDDMKWPYAALVWDRVLPMDSWDPALALRFFTTEAERLDADGALVAPPEKQCNPQASSSPSVSAGTSAAPSGLAAPSGSTPVASSAASPSPAPSASSSVSAAPS
jgi:hypothetical protein